VREGPPPFPGAEARARRIAEMIRVDHAGEFGAVPIYKGQRAVFEHVAGKAETADLIAEMEAGEAAHLETFDRLIAERNVRPTLMAPLWRFAGYGLGAVTALMGERAAHACTEAVETVIEEHYAAQSAALAALDPELKGVVDKFRADEVAHRDTAIAHGAREAAGYGLLSAVIAFGCRAAIRISEKI
jgi:ubiquinone biosynthesis monooxygenase Coq7